MRDESESKRSFDDVRREQKAAGECNEQRVLFGIAKFGWLSITQLAKLADVSSGTMRHIVRRMEQAKYIWSETLDHSPNVKCYALTRKGSAAVRQHFPEAEFKKIETYSQCRGFLSQFDHHYHRHLCNEFVVDLITENVNFHHREITYYLPEHEVQAKKNAVHTMMQCVPDALALTSDNELIVVEVENTMRGQSKHGTNLTHWLEVFASQIENNGYASDSLRGLFPALIEHIDDDVIYPDYTDVHQVFICASEPIFRNVWRKVNRILEQTSAPSAGDNIQYFIVDGRRWHSVFDDYELLLHSDPEVAERVANGADRFKFDKATRMQIVNERFSLGLSRKEVAKRHKISVSTLDRWAKDFRSLDSNTSK